MATETAEAPYVGGDVSKVFDQAFKAFGDSVKVATKAQEDAVKFWSEAVARANSSQAIAGEWIPTAQKNAEEYLKLLEASYKRNAELVKKVMQPQGPSDAMGLEKRTSEWLEASLAAARENAQDLANTNVRVVQAWTDALKKGTQQGEAFAQGMPPQAAAAK